MFYLDPSNRLATVHERYRQTDRQTDRQQSDSIGRTILQTVAQKLECGPMPNVTATQTNIGGAICETSTIPLSVLGRKVWPTPAAGVPYSNAANIGEHKTWK